MPDNNLRRFHIYKILDPAGNSVEVEAADDADAKFAGAKRLQCQAEACLAKYLWSTAVKRWAEGQVA